METRASYVLIGSFALAILVLAVVSILWLGNLSLDRDWDFYDVIFEEAVTGLGTGGAVQYNGIQVGEVRRLSLDPADPRKAIARVRVTAGTPIKLDTHATLTFTGLTGVSIIQLSGGTPDAPRLLPKAGQDAAVIVADESALQALLASGEGIATSANELLLRLSILLRDDNVVALSATLANLKTITGSIADHRGEISRALVDIAAVSHEFKGTLARAKQLMTTLDGTAASAQTLIERDGPQLIEQARGSLLAVQQAGERLSATLGPLRELAERLQAEPGLILQGASQPREQAPP